MVLKLNIWTFKWVWWIFELRFYFKEGQLQSWSSKLPKLAKIGNPKFLFLVSLHISWFFMNPLEFLDQIFTNEHSWHEEHDFDLKKSGVNFFLCTIDFPQSEWFSNYWPIKTLLEIIKDQYLILRFLGSHGEPWKQVGTKKLQMHCFNPKP